MFSWVSVNDKLHKYNILGYCKSYSISQPISISVYFSFQANHIPLHPKLSVYFISAPTPTIHWLISVMVITNLEVEHYSHLIK